jgi:hypothetical protein
LGAGTSREVAPERREIRRRVMGKSSIIVLSNREKEELD